MSYERMKGKEKGLVYKRKIDFFENDYKLK